MCTDILAYVIIFRKHLLGDKMEKYKNVRNGKKLKKCYVCKQLMIDTHPFYSMLCCTCGDYNEKKRNSKHNLHGYTALITGGRTKIGYYTALRLLREGAQVIITSRFPQDALQRYIKEPDFDTWSERIHIYGLDFRQLGRVEEFTCFLDKHSPYIDIIINNAAQTVKMSKEEYKTLALNEVELKKQLSGHPYQIKAEEILLSTVKDSEIVSQEYQPLALNQEETELINYYPPEQNSWIAKADQIPIVEMLEVQLINVTAPFLLSTNLKASMLRSPNQNRFIINVSSAEGKFNMKRKGHYHVHTNMAKASLNMMTLTMSKEYKRDRIFITSVDPGWVSNQYSPKELTKAPIQLPLDFHDAAARICDPIYEGMNADRPITGVFLKDYQQVEW